MAGDSALDFPAEEPHEHEEPVEGMPAAGTPLRSLAPAHFNLTGLMLTTRRLISSTRSRPPDSKARAA